MTISDIQSADETVFLWLNGLVGRVPFFDRFMAVMGDDWFVLTCLSLSMIALWFGAKDLEQRRLNQRAVWATAWGVGITCLWFHLFRIFDLFNRPRPHEDYAVNLLNYMHEDPSFPSETAAVAFAFVAAVWLANRRAGIAVGCLAFLWSFGRVYCGVHYPLDVVFGALIGISTSILMFRLFQIGNIAPDLFIRLLQRVHLA